MAGALLVVGCQNYDDQFDALEAQINAVTAAVAGLSQVQNDLQSLAGTVASIQSSIDSSVQTALASGLSDIDAAIETLNAAAESAANNSDIASINEGLTEVQSDLDTLLASSAVFTGDVTINSVATLDIFHGMGDAIAIVNGTVDINATADMDATKLQETIEQVLTTVKDFKYVATSSVPAMTFNNLTGTATLTLKQAGNYVAQNLTSAQNIYLYDDFKSKVNVIDFRLLTSVQKFYTDTTADKIAFNKATELHLTELVRYPPLNLTVELDEGAAFPNKLDDVDADGDQKDITLDITGPAAVTFTNILDGSMTFKDVATVTVNGFKGNFVIKDGVETFNSDQVVTMDITAASDLEVLDITGALDPDTTTDKTGPNVTFEDNNSITTITLAGKVGAIDLQGNGNLDAVTITAEVDGAIGIGATGTGNGNSDLATVTLTGASATAVNVIQNFDLETVTIDNTFIAGTATGAVVDGSISVVDNTSLTNLNISSAAVENLTVTGNDDLATIDFTGMATFGATGKPNVKIYDNDIEGTQVDEEEDGTDVADGKTGDLGDTTSESGIKTAYTYLAAVKADADATMSVFFDTVNFTTEGDTTSEVLWAAGTAAADQDAKLRIAYVVPNTADAGDSAITAKRSFVINDKVDLQLTVNNSTIFTIANLDDNNAVAVNTEILTADNLAAATAAGATLTATDGGGVILAKIKFDDNSATTENSQSVVAGAFAVHLSDTFTLTLEGTSVTLTGTTYTDNGVFADAVMDAWNAKYSTAGLNRWVASTAAADDGVLTFTAKDEGTGSLGQELGATFTIASKSLTNMGYIIGNATSLTESAGDNSSKGSSIVLTLEANTSGDLLSEIGKFGDAVGNGAKKYH